MTLDINSILKDWPYERGQISARKIRGDDGKDKIQLRLDLGLLQMEVAGRPDGQRPHGHESLLGYYEHLLKRHSQEGSSDEEFQLDVQACELLRNEGVMYYHRYLAEFILEDYEAVLRDTCRNLNLMNFCSAHALAESDRHVLEQYRPYVIMMHTRANGLLALRDDRTEAALAAVEEGVQKLQDFYDRFGQDDLGCGSDELDILRTLAKQIKQRIPPDPVEKVKHQLTLAIKAERYEEAADLRDQLRHMTDKQQAGM